MGWKETCQEDSEAGEGGERLWTATADPQLWPWRPGNHFTPGLCSGGCKNCGAVPQTILTFSFVVAKKLLSDTFFFLFSLLIM